MDRDEAIATIERELHRGLRSRALGEAGAPSVTDMAVAIADALVGFAENEWLAALERRIGELEIAVGVER